MKIMGEERERFNASAWRDFENAINDIYERLNELESFKGKHKGKL